MANPFPLNIANKEDSFEKETLLAHVDQRFKYTAEEFNQILAALKYLYDNAGGAIAQDNIPRVISLSATEATAQQFASAINQAQSFTISEKEIAFLIIGVPGTDPMATPLYTVILNNLGKGTYGNGGTQVSESNISIIGERGISPAYVEDIPSTQLINLGNIGSTAIATAFNNHTFTGLENPVQNQDQGYVLVKAVMAGVPVKYLFTGEGGNYGTTGNKTAIEDNFGFFKAEVDSYKQNIVENRQTDGGLITAVTGFSNFTNFTNKTTPVIIAGITYTKDGVTTTLWNNTASDITLLHNNSQASPNNRLMNFGEVDIMLPIDGKVIYRYAYSIRKWTMIYMSGMAGSGIVPTNTIKGRIAAGSGVPKDLTVSEVKTMLGLEEFTTQEISSGGNYNNLEVTANLLVFTNTNAQAILNGVWGKKDFHILNLSPTYDVMVNHDSASVTDPLRRIKLPTNAGSVGVKGTARVLFTESYGYFISDTWGSLYRPEFKGLTEEEIVTVNENSNAGSKKIVELKVFRDAQSTPMTKAELNTAYPTSVRGFEVICKLINTSYVKIDNNTNDWVSISNTAVS